MTAATAESKPTTPMSRDEQHARAIARAKAERLTATKLANGQFLVKSRYQAPGSYHVLTVDQQGQIHCDAACPGFQYRGSCVHVATVARRLARESKRPAVQPQPWRDSLRVHQVACAACGTATTQRGSGVVLCASCEAREVARAYSQCFQD